MIFGYILIEKVHVIIDMIKDSFAFQLSHSTHTQPFFLSHKVKLEFFTETAVVKIVKVIFFKR